MSYVNEYWVLTPNGLKKVLEEAGITDLTDHTLLPTLAQKFEGLTPSGLLSMVFAGGSTTLGWKNWRKQPEWQTPLYEGHHMWYDPQLVDEEWHELFGQLEAFVGSVCSVVLIRLENQEIVDGSLGSLFEIGIFLVSAIMRGQILIISREESFLESLHAPESRAQFAVVQTMVQKFHELYPDQVILHVGDDLTELANLINLKMTQQNLHPVSAIEYNQEIRDTRAEKLIKQVTIAGSASLYTKDQSKFYQNLCMIKDLFSSPTTQLTVLTEGQWTEPWKLAWGMYESHRVALEYEWIIKSNTDSLIIPIMSEALSQGGTTEIGFLLLLGFLQGQEVTVILESFDPGHYLAERMRQRFNGDVNASAGHARESEAGMRKILLEVGIPEVALEGASMEEINGALTLYMAALLSESVTFKQWRNSLFSKSPLFWFADNVRRVRTLAEVHLDRLYGEFPFLFHYFKSLSELQALNNQHQ